MTHRMHLHLHLTNITLLGISYYHTIINKGVSVLYIYIYRNCSILQEVDWENAKSIYEFHAKDIDGNNVNLDKYK